jgi:putative transposase
MNAGRQGSRSKWKARYGGLEVSEARRLKALEDENRRRKKLLAEAVLDVAALKDLLAKMYGPPRLARLKMMIEVALHQCIRPLASGLIFPARP